MPQGEKYKYSEKEKRQVEKFEKGYEEYGVPEDVAHGRGHGRSSQPWNANETDTYAAELAEFIEALELHGITLAALPSVDGEVARTIGRYGSKTSSRRR